MTPEPHDPHAPEDFSGLSRRTTPTWEMELLISGATVFGLMQLPPHADRLLFGLYNSATPDVAAMVMPLWVYAKFVLLTLIATFVAHLALRGYWVALAGLASVYPQGIRWDRLEKRMGPLYLEASRSDMSDMAVAIERADNRASRVFGVGFGMATTMLVPIVMVVVLMAVLWLYRVLGGRHEDAAMIALGLFVVFPTLLGIVVMWDRWRGTNATPLETRVMRAMLRFYSSLGFGRNSNPLLTLFSTNEGGGRTGLVVGGAMAVIFVIVTLQGVSDRLGWSMGDYVGLPVDRVTTAESVNPAHYASEGGDVPRLSPVPTIPDPVVRGKYLRLFVPYFPQRHNPAMRRECAAALADTTDTGVRARLDCLAKLHAVAIDGQAQAIHFDAAEDAHGQRGMLAMIPVGTLADGRHELTVMPATRKAEAEYDEPTRPFRIPFWR